MKTTLLIPVLNELIGMKEIMPQIKKEWYDQIIILDGGSTDGTIEYSKEMGYFVYKQKKRGLRNAYNEVLQYIEGDILLTFSPDGNCLPELIPELVKKMKDGFDMVVVSRYLDDASSEDDDAVTSFGNWLFTTSINIFHGGKYTDSMGIYRAYKTQIIYDLDLDKPESYSFPEKLFRTNISWEPLLSIRAAKRKLKISEIPGDEPARIGGDRKLQVIKWGAAYYFQVLREIFCWK